MKKVIIAAAAFASLYAMNVKIAPISSSVSAKDSRFIESIMTKKDDILILLHFKDKKIRKSSYMGFHKTCFYGNDYESCVIVNPNYYGPESKQRIRVYNFFDKSFRVQPKLFTFDNRYGFVLMLIKRDPKKKLSGREISGIAKIKDVIDYLSERSGISKKNIFIIAEISKKPEIIEKISKIAVHYRDKNRVGANGKRMFYDLSVLNERTDFKEGISSKTDFGIFKRSGVNIKEYAKKQKFIPVSIEVY